MPVIRLHKDRFEELVPGIKREELEELLFRLKCEVEEVDQDYVEIEVNPDRVDMYIGEGISRALKGLLGIEKGIPEYRVNDTGFTTVVENVVSRPYIGVAIVYDVNIDERYLEELIQFQEKIHQTYGRKRKKIAIGLHDLEKVPSKKLAYKLVDIDSTSFVPLGYDKEMPVREILSKTPQGREYGQISIYKNRYHPAILSGDDIISLPPVINAELTRIEPGTKNVLIDVTGIRKSDVVKILDVLVTNLSERGGRLLGRVEITEYNGRQYYTPILGSEILRLSVSYTNKILGTSLDSRGIAELLEKMRYAAQVIDTEWVETIVPPYRVDILHTIDLIEDVAIAIGYEELGVAKPRLMLRGKTDELNDFTNIVAEMLVGYGFQEIYSFILDSLNRQSLFVNTDSVVTIENPVTIDLNSLRATLLSPLVEFMEKNQHAKMPIKVFEIGPVAYIVDNNVVEETRLGIGIMDNSISYEDIQAIVYGLMRILGLQPSAKPGRTRGFLEGRIGVLVVDDTEVGIMGEVHPEILEKMGIKYPIALAELSIDKLFRLYMEKAR